MTTVITTYARWEERSRLSSIETVDHALRRLADDGYSRFGRDKYGRILLSLSAEQNDRGTYLTLELKEYTHGL